MTTKLRPDPIPCTSIMSSATRGALNNPHSNFVLTGRRCTGGLGSTMFPNRRNNPLVRIVTNGTITFGITTAPRFGSHVRHALSNTGVFTRHLVTSSIGGGNVDILANNASIRLIVISLHGDRVSNGRNRSLLTRYNVAVGHGAIPFSPHPTSITSNLHVNADTLTAHNFKPGRCRRITSVVNATLTTKRSTSISTLGTHISGLTRSFPLCPKLSRVR